MKIGINKIKDMKYGDLPEDLGRYKVNCDEMMFYQYLPIKLSESLLIRCEKRLLCFRQLLDAVRDDFIENYGIDRYYNSYMYVTAKHMYQPPGNSFNRHGYHTDGFMTEDINYIWCDADPTTFNTSEFKLTMDDTISMREMEEQALVENEVKYPINSLLRLNQYNVHKVTESDALSLRTFLKVSFSEDKYDLKGNSKNYHLNYNWEMKDRKVERNIPQTNING